jgi:N-acetylglucosaminyl-diphospho-decaprenol L-rhamnosyltransferase
MDEWCAAARRDCNVNPGIAVVILNYRTPDLALESARAAATSDGISNPQVIIVDGGSGDGSAARMREALQAEPDPRITLLPLELNGGFAYGNNRAMIWIASQGPLPEYIALINPDARVRPGALRIMADLLERNERAGAVGARLEHEDGGIQGSAFNFPSIRGEFARGAQTGVLEKLLRVPPIEIRPTAAVQVPWVTGAAVMLRTEALRQAGLFDEGFFLYFEETDLMRRIRACGWDIWHEPAARVVHHGGVATQIRDTKTGRQARGKPMPKYWFEARRRYFALAGGSPMALGSAAAWLAGRAIWLARRTLTRTGDTGARNLTRDFLRHATLPSGSDSKPFIPGFDSPFDALPGWQQKGSK